MLEEIIGDLPVASNIHKFLGKFHSGTLRFVDTMRLISLFSVIGRTPIPVVGIHLKHLFTDCTVNAEKYSDRSRDGPNEVKS